MKRTVTLVVLCACAQVVKTCSMSRDDCISTCSTESEWQVKLVGVRRWTKLRDGSVSLALVVLCEYTHRVRA